MLSPADVEQKTFSTALRGYDLDEVDDFLDEIVNTLKELNQQLEAARAARDEQASAPEMAPGPVPAPEEEPRPAAKAGEDVDESAIGRALLAAQNAADQLLEEAQGQAHQILEEAKSEADSFISDRDARKREVEAELAALSARVSSVRSELSVLAGEVAEKLDDMDQILTGTAETDTGPVVDDADDLDSDDTTDEVDALDPPEDGEGEDGENGGSDHLDEILTGVTTDLRLDSDVPEAADEGGGEDEDHEDPQNRADREDH